MVKGFSSTDARGMRKKKGVDTNASEFKSVLSDLKIFNMTCKVPFHIPHIALLVFWRKQKMCCGSAVVIHYFYVFI